MKKIVAILLALALAFALAACGASGAAGPCGGPRSAETGGKRFSFWGGYATIGAEIPPL